MQTPDPNEKGSHWGILPYDNNEWKMWIEWNLPNYCQVFLNLRGLFCASTFTSNFLIVFLDVHTKENNISPLCISCTLMPKLTSSYTHVNLYNGKMSPNHGELKSSLMLNLPYSQISVLYTWLVLQIGDTNPRLSSYMMVYEMKHVCYESSVEFN